MKIVLEIEKSRTLPGFYYAHLLFTRTLTSARCLTGFTAIIHARFTAPLCTFGTMVHFAVTAWGIGGSVSKGANGKQHHYNDEKKMFHDF